MNPPNLFEIDLWTRHQERVMEILICALQRLVMSPTLPECENDLNRQLLFRFREENQKLLKVGRGVASPIYYECNNQPLEEHTRAANEFKRPDFNVGYVDTKLGRDMFFYIEAKRLGLPLSSGWKVNEEYCNNGIRRFTDHKWAYGAGYNAASMVGYIQTSDHDVILAEVNTNGVPMGFTAIKRESANWEIGGVSRLNQILTRPISPSPFGLRHAWVDLRSCKTISFVPPLSVKSGKSLRTKKQRKS